MKLKLDIPEIEKTLRLSSGKVELRILRNESGIADIGIFDNKETLIQTLKDYDANEPVQVYITRQHLSDSVVQTYNEHYNKLEYKAPRAVKDGDSDYYMYFIVDLDPERPSKTSATDEEKRSALELANTVMQYLERKGWPFPIIADSGNGFHLLYRIQLANNDDNKRLLKDCLKALNDLFGNDECHVDRINYNQSRILKLYGTEATKGENTTERPWRMSKILAPNEEHYYEIKKVPKKLLQELAETVRAKPKPQKTYIASGDNDSLNLKEFFAKHGIEYEDKSYTSKGEYVEKYWVMCPFSDDHTSETRLKDAVIYKNPSGVITFSCSHSHCADKTWHDFREYYEPGCYDKLPSIFKNEEQEQQFNRDLFNYVINDNTVSVELKDKQTDATEEIIEKLWMTPEYIRANKVDDVEYVKTGFKDLDYKVCGVKKPGICILTGDNGSAKSTIVSQMALNMIADGNRVLIFSGELEADEVCDWMELQAAGKAYTVEAEDDIWTISDDIRSRIDEWIGDKLRVYENSNGMSWDNVKSSLEMALARHKCDVLFLDNRMMLNVAIPGYNQEYAETVWINDLNNISEKFHIAIVLVAHPRKIGRMLIEKEDVRGGKCMTDAADLVLAAYRTDAGGRWGDIENAPQFDLDVTNAIQILKIRRKGKSTYARTWVQLYYEAETMRLNSELHEHREYGWSKKGILDDLKGPLDDENTSEEERAKIEAEEEPSDEFMTLTQEDFDALDELGL